MLSSLFDVGFLPGNASSTDWADWSFNVTNSLGSKAANTTNTLLEHASHVDWGSLAQATGNAIVQATVEGVPAACNRLWNMTVFTATQLGKFGDTVYSASPLCPMISDPATCLPMRFKENINTGDLVLPLLVTAGLAYVSFRLTHRAFKENIALCCGRNVVLSESHLKNNAKPTTRSDLAVKVTINDKEVTPAGQDPKVKKVQRRAVPDVQISQWTEKSPSVVRAFTFSVLSPLSLYCAAVFASGIARHVLQK